MCLMVSTIGVDEKVLEGAPGFEPGTSLSAVECSTTELYPYDSNRLSNGTLTWALFLRS